MSSALARATRNQLAPSHASRQLYSGIHRLAEMPMLINGLAPNPTLRYKGGDADGTNWDPWTYGDTPTLQAGTAPSYNQGSPLLGSIDDSVKFNAGGYYSLPSHGAGCLVGTNDLVFEIILKFDGIASKYYISCYTATLGWVCYSTGTDSVGLLIYDGSNLAVPQATGLVAGCVYHLIWFMDRSGSGVCYTNAVQGTAGAISGAPNSISNGAPLHIGDYSGTGSAAAIDIHYAALWDSAAWLDTHLQATVAASRFAALTSSRPLISYGGSVAPTAKGSTSVTYQRKVTAGVTRLWQVGAGFPRSERVLDADGREFVGSLVEGGATQLISTPNVLTGGNWDGNNCTVTTGVAGSPDGASNFNRIVEATCVGGYVSRFNLVAACVAGEVWKVSAFLKHGDRHAILQMTNGNDWKHAGIVIDLAAGVVTDTVSTPAQIALLDYYLEPCGSGVYRAAVEGTIGLGTANFFALVGLCAGDSFDDWPYDGDSVAYPLGALVYGLNVTKDQEDRAGSYISSQAARAADVLRYSITEGSDVGSKMGAARFRFLAPSFTPGRSHYLWSISDGGAAADMIGIYLDTSGYLNVESAATGGSAGAVQIATNYCDNHIHEVLCSWQEGRLDLWCDGIPGTPDTSVNIPDDIDTMDIGTDEAQANHAGPVLVADWKLYPRYLSSWARRGSGFTS